MADEPDGTLMTTSLPPDRISLFSNLDDDETWLMSVDDKPNDDLNDWLDGAMKDFDKSGLKRQKRKLQQQNNNSNGCDLITEEDEGNDIFYDAEAEFENDKSSPFHKEKPLTTSTPSYKANNILDSNGPLYTSTPKMVSKTKSVSPNTKGNGMGKSGITVADLEKLANEQERELLELLFEESRPTSSASNFGTTSNTSARSNCSVPQSTSGLLVHDNSNLSMNSNVSPAPTTTSVKSEPSSISTASTLRPAKNSKIPIPQRFALRPNISRRSNGVASHISQSSRPYSSGGDSNSDTSSNPDQWGGNCF